MRVDRGRLVSRLAVHRAQSQRVRYQRTIKHSGVTTFRISTVLLAVFAGISTLLAALGIHGVVSYGVTQRTREFGLRMALGSTPGQLTALVIWNGVGTALIGLAAGMAGAAALASALRALLYAVFTLCQLNESLASFAIPTAHYIGLLRTVSNQARRSDVA